MSNPVSRESRRGPLPIPAGRRGLPFFVEFVKFATGFVTIVAVALLVLKAASW